LSVIEINDALDDLNADAGIVSSAMFKKGDA
jgi:hypothetical protein